jgi:hypothetical protein
MFSGPRVSKEDIQQQRDALIKYLNELGGERGFKCDVTVLVEQSLGVWKTSLRRFIAFKTAHELGEWERGFRDLKEFWVVAPNFLGDKDQNVHQAMISNLQRGVKYTYFLSSYADYLRLRSLARSLEQSVRFVNVYDLIKTVLLVTDLDHREDAKKVLEKQYFIANPHRNDREGYELKRSETEEVHVGVRIDDDCIKGIVDKFSLLINRESMVQWVRLPLDFRNKEEEAAVLCTALEANPKQLESLNGRGLNRWEKVIRNYDRIIAEEVSKLGGEVAKGDPNGYLILFDKAKYALLCSEQLQIAMQEFNAGPSLECKLPRQRIALDYGSISRVIRASGVDYFGTPLIRCSILIDNCSSRFLRDK